MSTQKKPKLSNAKKIASNKRFRESSLYATEPNKIYFVDFKNKSLVYIEDDSVDYNQSYAKVWRGNAITWFRNFR